MCDYSLHSVQSRPAKIGDVLVTTQFAMTVTRGFASVEHLGVAVCLRPGTELAFDKEPLYQRAFTRWLLPRIKPSRIASKVARVRLINQDWAEAHHDALEFADGTMVLVTRLCTGQRATVLQLPPDAQKDSVPPEKKMHLVHIG